jgi:hypothetical protein
VVNVEELSQTWQQLARQDIEIVLPAVDVFSEELRIMVLNTCNERL